MTEFKVDVTDPSFLPAFRPHRQTTNWTPKLDAQITGGLEVGLSLGQIARLMKKSRNAVIGRSYRLRGYKRPRHKSPAAVLPHTGISGGME